MSPKQIADVLRCRIERLSNPCAGEVMEGYESCKLLLAMWKCHSEVLWNRNVFDVNQSAVLRSPVCVPSGR